MVNTEPRLNTKLEAEGAEFLVLGHILVENIECYKAYTNYPGYDLIATSPQSGRVARIQVKSRWATNRAGFFPISNMDCDFVVHVALNRGERKQRKNLSNQINDPDFYIFPIAVIRAARGKANKVNIKKISNLSSYKSNWTPIKDFLAVS